MITFKLTDSNGIVEFYGLSTDGKPCNHGHTKGETSYVYYDKYASFANGSIYFCIDSGDAFMLKVVPNGTTPETYTDTWGTL